MQRSGIRKHPGLNNPGFRFIRATELRFHAVNHYLGVRHRNHELLRHHGALTLDLLAPQLPAALVNQYLAIKDSGAL